MLIIKQSVEILDTLDGFNILKKLERIGRVSWKSEHLVTEHSAAPFIRMLIRKGHESVLEHEKVTALVICDRGVSHEIVRHRIGSYTQESTRYCNYNKTGEITFIEPLFNPKTNYYDLWLCAVSNAAGVYLRLIRDGAKPEEARAVLLNSLKTEIVITYNLRQWRHFFKLRALGTTGKPHPQMQEVAIMLLTKLNSLIPVVFDDLWEDLERRKNERTKTPREEVQP